MLGIRYPALDSSSLASDIQDMMTDIDDAMLATATLASSLDATDGCRVWGGGGTAASGGSVLLTFGLSSYDTASIWGPATVFVFPPGYWLINMSMTCTVAGNTNHAGMYVSYNGRFYQSQVSNILQSVTQLTNTFMIRATPTGGNLTVTGTANGTGGGNFTISNGVLRAHRLRLG